MNLSIAMCTYNGALHLPAQLESIAAQALLPDELVLCDDGSSDGTLQIAEEFSRTAPFPMRILRNERNLGHSKNFERCIQLCQGKFIALSDQDDIWYPQKLANLSAVLDQDQLCGGVFSDGDVLDANLVPTGRTLWQSFRFFKADQGRFSREDPVGVLLKRNVVTGMTLMFRSELRDRLLPVPADWIHDGWLAFMLVLHSKLAACPDRLVGYRSHQSQQVGAPPTARQNLRRITSRGISCYLDQARSRSLADYELAARQFDGLITYLQSHKEQVDASVLPRACAKSAFCHAALATSSRSKKHRVASILARAEDYRKYSALWFRPMFRDLVL